MDRKHKKLLAEVVRRDTINRETTEHNDIIQDTTYDINIIEWTD